MEEARLRELEVGVGSGWQQGPEGRPPGGSCGRAAPHAAWSPQELSKREVVAVGHLEVPAELAGLLQAVAGTSMQGGVGKGWAGTESGTSHPPLSTGLRAARGPRVAPVRTPRLQAEPRVTLPLDINNYPMAKFVRCHFKVKAGMNPSSPGQQALLSAWGRVLAMPCGMGSYPEPLTCRVMRSPGAPEEGQTDMEGPQGLRKWPFAKYLIPAFISGSPGRGSPGGSGGLHHQ